MIVVVVTIMFTFARTSLDIVYAPNIEDVRFSVWLYLLGVIPLMHMVFGFAYYIHIIKQNVSSNSQTYQMFSLQSIFTLFMVLLWIGWCITQLTGVATGGTNGLFVSLGLELELSIGVITLTITNSNPKGATASAISRKNNSSNL
jgi:hypothetical protein